MLLKNKYVYVTSNRNVPDVFLPGKSIAYYQICAFPDPKTKRYHMRKILYDGDNNVSDIVYYYLSPEQQNLFFTYKKPYEYGEVSYYDFTLVDLPSVPILDQARSELFTDRGDGFNHKLV